MTVTDAVDIYGPDEVWVIETATTTERLTGRFMSNTIGTPLYFQTTARRVIFMAWIVSAQREDDKEAKLNPY